MIGVAADGGWGFWIPWTIGLLICLWGIVPVIIDWLKGE